MRSAVRKSETSRRRLALRGNERRLVTQHPRRRILSLAVGAATLSATVAFAVYFPIAGTTFLGIYTLPPFKYEDWQLAAAVPLGLAAGTLALITVAAIGLLAKLTAPLAKRTILRPALGESRSGWSAWPCR